jgi:hypothetical protein
MRNRVYFNVREKNLSVLDYKTNKVTRKVSQVYLTNAMFVVRKSGNKRVREEGRKNVHAFVNGIIQNRLPNNQELFYNAHKVRYDPYTMDCFHYERIVNGKSRWLPIDKHWIGRVWIYVENGKPNMYADIDKLLNDDTNLLNGDTNERLMVIEGDSYQKAIFPNGALEFSFLNKKRKIIENKNKINKKVVAI